jgi:hypothetical protein
MGSSPFTLTFGFCYVARSQTVPLP